LYHPILSYCFDIYLGGLKKISKTCKDGQPSGPDFNPWPVEQETEMLPAQRRRWMEWQQCWHTCTNEAL